MKRFFSSTWIILSLVILTIAPTLNMVLSSEASAGSPALQQLVDDIRANCSDMEQGTDTWKDCEEKQNRLALFANCSTKMFGDKDSKGRRSFKKAQLDDCQKKINNNKIVASRSTKMLNWITDNCNGVSDMPGAYGTIVGGIGSIPGMILANRLDLQGQIEKGWKSCEAMQGELATIGCSSEMFESKDNWGPWTGKRWYYKQSEVDSCRKVIKDIKTSEDTKPGDSPEEAGDDMPCRGGPMGWVMCPLIEVMSKAISAFASFIDNMMQFRLLSQTNSQESLREVWQTFLNIANIFLAFAFLAIIFSQTTSMGLSNYGIKRMLPRLIMAAILMNISFYICAVAIDLSNILGSSVMGLFSNLTNISSWNYSEGEQVHKAFTETGGSGGLAQGFVGLLGLGIAVVVIILFFLVPVLLTLAMVFIVLVARQVILTVLVVVAPLAFAAWLLPNTEQYFKKWWSTFSQMLFAYPMVMAVFGAAIFVAQLIQGVNQVASHTGAAEIGGPAVISTIVPLIVLAIPLFAIPKVIMSSNAIMGKIGNAANSVNKRVWGDKAEGRIKEARANSDYARGKAIRKEARRNFKDKKYSERLSNNRGLRNKYTRAASRGVRGNMPSAWRSEQVDHENEALDRAAYGQASKAKSESVKIAEEKLKDQFGGDHAKILSHLKRSGAGSLSSDEVEAAIGLMAKNGGGESIRELMTGSDGASFVQQHGSAVQGAARRDFADIKATSPDVAAALSGADLTTDSRQDIVASMDGHDWSTIGKAGDLASLSPEAAVRLEASMGGGSMTAEQKSTVKRLAQQAIDPNNSSLLTSSKQGTIDSIARLAR